MAESLVNLTSFKRRVTMDAETVGGPIDVAVISKGRRICLDQEKALLYEGTESSFCSELLSR